jgi:tripartite-type tricarboxylate transporter receptor subunit TctC
MAGVRHASLVAATLAALAGVTAPGAAQTVEEFYKGKNIDLMIGYPPAGSNDVYARALARHLGKHIPGNPTVIPRNMPGAGSFLAVNQVFNVAPKDGATLGIGAPTLAIDEKLGTSGVRYKTAEMNWLGRIDSLINMVFMWHTSPVKTIQDAFKTQATLAGTGAGSTVSIYPNAMNNVLGTKFKLVMGYKGSNEAQLAVERGEVEGHSTSYTALKVAHSDWLRDKKVNIIVQFAQKRHPEMQNVPTVVELARNDEERAILSAIVAASEVGTSFFTTPGAPADRVAALRHAFDETMKDPEFLSEAGKQQLSVGPMTGQELQAVIASVSGLSGDLLEKVRTAYTKKP